MKRRNAGRKHRYMGFITSITELISDRQEITRIWYSTQCLVLLWHKCYVLHDLTLFKLDWAVSVYYVAIVVAVTFGKRVRTCLLFAAGSMKYNLCNRSRCSFYQTRMIRRTEKKRIQGRLCKKCHVHMFCSKKEFITWAMYTYAKGVKANIEQHCI